MTAKVDMWEEDRFRLLLISWKCTDRLIVVPVSILSFVVNCWERQDNYIIGYNKSLHTKTIRLLHALQTQDIWCHCWKISTRIHKQCYNSNKNSFIKLRLTLARQSRVKSWSLTRNIIGNGHDQTSLWPGIVWKYSCLLNIFYFYKLGSEVRIELLVMRSVSVFCWMFILSSHNRPV